MGGGILTDVAAQNSGSATVQGIVRDEVTKEPVVGAQVWIKDSSYGTITDGEGRYSIKYSGKYALLCVSFFGYEDVEVDLTGKNQTADITLKEGGLSIEETVVVAYGTQKKASVVGAITTVAPQTLDMPAPTIANVLGGQVAGVIAYQNNGEPGASSQFWIRGVASFAGNTSPLCLVDGVERSIDLVDPSDIKEFSVLKDASATAIYGVRGANGVVLITTHQGTESKVKISARYETGLVAPSMVPETVNSVQFAEIYNDAATAAGQPSLCFTPEQIELYRNGTDPDMYPNVNWMSEVFKKITPTHRGNVQITGGTKLVKYYIGAGVYYEGGLYAEDPQFAYRTDINFTKYNFRANVDLQVEKNTTLTFNMATIFEERRSPGHSAGTIFKAALTIPSNQYPVRYSTGELAGPNPNTGWNPYALAAHSGYNLNYVNNAQSLVGLTHDFKWLLDGLKANVKFSFDAVNAHAHNRTRTPEVYQMMEKNENGEIVRYLHQHEIGSTALGYGHGTSGNRRIYLEASLNYAKSFGKHNVTGLFLFQQSSKVNLTAGSSEAAVPYRNQGIAGRVTYDYDSRYFIEFNAGYNGSENFAKGHRYGFFPSMAVGYLMSEEPWWQDIKGVVDMFKIRGSWGTVGNADVGDRFLYMGKVGGGETAWFGTNNKAYGTIRESRAENPNVGWETAEKRDLGIDLSLFGKLKLQADLFYEKRTGILIQRKTIPTYMGLSVNPWINMGRMDNSGFDMTADYRQTIGEVTLSAKGTFTFARNVIVEQDEALNEWSYQDGTGQAHWQNFGLVSDGLFQSWEDIESHADQSAFSPQPGDIKYVDLNNDGIIDINDRKPIGWRNIPEIIYGAGLSAEWKGFDISVFFQGNAHVSVDTRAVGGTLLRGITSSNSDMHNSNVLLDVYQNYWTPERTDAKYPRLNFLQESVNNSQVSDFWVKDISYIRLQNAEIGWNLPKRWTSKMNMSGLRVYLQGQNLFTISDFKLWDANFTGSGGNTVFTYPTTRVVSFGVSASF